jgi:hypothetical protein
VAGVEQLIESAAEFIQELEKGGVQRANLSKRLSEKLLPVSRLIA